jgi:hypothetical protein
VCIDLPMHYKLTCREQLARTLARGRVQLFSAPHPAANRRPGQLVVTSRPITVASAAGALSRGSSVSYVPLSGSEPITMCSDPGALIDSLDAAAAAAAAAAAGAAMDRGASNEVAFNRGAANGGASNGGASNGGASNGGALSSPAANGGASSSLGSRPGVGGLAVSVAVEGEVEGEGLVGLEEAGRSLRAAQRADLAALGRLFAVVYSKQPALADAPPAGRHTGSLSVHLPVCPQYAGVPVTRTHSLYPPSLFHTCSLLSSACPDCPLQRVTALLM